MKALIYTKQNCSYCVKAKNLLNIKQVEFTEVEIGKDMLREDFISMFPEQKSVPLIFIDDNRIGGYDDLRKYFDSKANA